MGELKKLNVLLIGSGEYTVGYVPTAHGPAADKPAGVVALTCFDLRRQGLVDRILLADRNGTRYPEVRRLVQSKIGDVYAGLDTTLETFPSDDTQHDDGAVLRALDTLSPADVAIIFTPDDTHHQLATACVRRGLHTLVAKPLVKSLDHHRDLAQEATRAGVLLATEYHKRFDPIYRDAINRIAALGPFSFFSSYMSQPKKQLDTFSKWAGRASDISFYLNSHHIDVHNWAVCRFARPVRVAATASTGVAAARLGRPCEDVITLVAQWEEKETDSSGSSSSSSSAPGLHHHRSQGTAVYTASWVAPPGDCHTQQHFHYVGQRGELRVDQAHRGYSAATDAAGYASVNPLYMTYVPDAQGRFAGQGGYGYVSIAHFCRAAADLNAGRQTVEGLRAEGLLALVWDTLPVTAVLEAGRLSLDNDGAAVHVVYGDDGQPCSLRVARNDGGGGSGSTPPRPDCSTGHGIEPQATTR